MYTLVHSRGGGGQKWSKFGPRSCWMPTKSSILLQKHFPMAILEVRISLHVPSLHVCRDKRINRSGVFLHWRLLMEAKWVEILYDGANSFLSNCVLMRCDIMVKKFKSHMGNWNLKKFRPHIGKKQTETDGNRRKQMETDRNRQENTGIDKIKYLIYLI
jgi:hypothetical protein